MREELEIDDGNRITKWGSNPTVKYADCMAKAEDASPGRKDDNKKTRTDLLPVDALLQVADVLTYGAEKYKDRNWEKGIDFGRVYGALLRHLFEWHQCRPTDTESGRSHMAHAATNALFLLHYSLDPIYSCFDDRPRPGGKQG